MPAAKPSPLLSSRKHRVIGRPFLLAQGFALTLGILSGSAVAVAPAVPHLAVVADNAVDGLRALGGRREESFQVLLWRTNNYLWDHFKDTKLEAIRKELDAG